MKTNELNNGIKEVYTKPALEVEDMEVQWNFAADTTQSGASQGELQCPANTCSDDCSDDECETDGL